MPAYMGESCFLYSPLWPDYFALVLGGLEVTCFDLHIEFDFCVKVLSYSPLDGREIFLGGSSELDN